jgi:hypothetical protein
MQGFLIDKATVLGSTIKDITVAQNFVSVPAVPSLYEVNKMVSLLNLCSWATSLLKKVLPEYKIEWDTHPVGE